MQKIIHSLLGSFMSLAVVSTGTAQWQQIPSGTNDSLTAVTWVQERFFITGGDLTFLRSSDNGVSFSTTNGHAPGLFPASFDHLVFHDSLWGYGTNTFACCALQRTTDGGETWEVEGQGGGGTTPLRLPLNSVDQVVFKSSPAVPFDADGMLLLETAVNIFAELDSVCPVPGQDGCWVEGTGEDAIYSTVSYGWTLTSNDRGATIQSGTFPYGYYVYSAHAVNGDTVAYVDFDRNLFLSHDKGVTWAKRGLVPFHISTITPAFRMRTAAKGVACDGAGLIHLTEDSGATWFPVPTPTNTPLNDILFLDEYNVLAIGDQGTILTSFDGGYSWEQETSGTNARLHALTMSEDAVIVIGNDGVILRRFPALFGFPTSVENRDSEALNMFPNPASEWINVSLGQGASGTMHFAIVDAWGRRQAIQGEQSGEHMWRLDIRHLSCGAHTLEMSNGGRTLRRMFMVVQ